MKCRLCGAEVNVSPVYGGNGEVIREYYDCNSCGWYGWKALNYVYKDEDKQNVWP